MENNDTLEVIQRIPLDKLRPYPDHPFGVRDDDMMQQTVESMIVLNLASERCVATDEICVKGVRGCFPDKRFISSCFGRGL